MKEIFNVVYYFALYSAERKKTNFQNNLFRKLKKKEKEKKEGQTEEVNNDRRFSLH